MSEIEVPRFLDVPEDIWVKCEETRKLSEMEAACLISAVGDELRLIIVEPAYCEMTKNLVRGVKVGTAFSDITSWLIDFPSGQRILVPEEKVEYGSTV